MEWSGDFARHRDNKSVCPIRQEGFVNTQLWNTRATAPLIAENAALLAALDAAREALEWAQARAEQDCLPNLFLKTTAALTTITAHLAKHKENSDEA
jgi:phage terminase Nu1 subunit (DNA packaging protein)